ncbi:NUDIX domain-containing protein [Candidatus Uhrbacteria bacterium]|nr:NUDIX domain-containing protein [Candidatus Uhrbacteria bacterium]
MQSSRWFSLRTFRSIYRRVPRLCVEVVLRVPKGVVLTKRDIVPWKGQWHLPGGTVRMRETLAHAVVRVAMEELGVRVRIVRVLGPIEYLRAPAWYGHPVGVAFLVRRSGGQLRGSWQGREVRTFAKLPKPMIREQRQFLMRELRME